MKEQNFLKGWIAQPYDENAGYDCMYPGVKIELEDGHPIVTVDEGSFMFDDGIRNSKVLVHRIASMIAAAPDMLEVIAAIEVALSKGMSAAEVLDEKSAIRKALKAAAVKATWG